MTRRNARRSTQVVRTSILALAAMAAAPSIMSPHLAHASTFTWDNNGATAPIGQDGAGSWDNLLLNFTDGASNFAWNNANNDTAVFGNGANGGAVAVSTGITIGGLQINNTGYTFSGGSFITTGPTTIGLATGTMSMSTPITGTGPVTFNIGPTATGTLTSVNTYSGTTTFMGGGTLAFGTTTFSGTGAIVLSGATIIDVANPGNIANGVAVTSSTTDTILLPNNGTFTGVISGGGILNFNSSGKVYSFNEGSTSLNTFSGTISLGATSAAIRITSANAGFPNARIDLGTGAGSFLPRVATATIPIGALFGGPNTALTGDTNTSTDGIKTFQIGGAGVDSIFNGTISDGNAVTRATSIEKVGNNTLTLNGTGTYTGTTTITGGTLTLGTSNGVAKSASVFVNNGTGAFNVTAMGAGGYTIPAGQSLRGNGGTIYGNVNVTNPTGVLAPGSGSTALSSGALTFANNLTLNGGTILLDVNSGTNDLINVNGALTPASGNVFHHFRWRRSLGLHY